MLLLFFFYHSLLLINLRFRRRLIHNACRENFSFEHKGLQISFKFILFGTKVFWRDIQLTRLHPVSKLALMLRLLLAFLENGNWIFIIKRWLSLTLYAIVRGLHKPHQWLFLSLFISHLGKGLLVVFILILSNFINFGFPCVDFILFLFLQLLYIILYFFLLVNDYAVLVCVLCDNFTYTGISGNIQNGLALTVLDVDKLRISKQQNLANLEETCLRCDV